MAKIGYTNSEVSKYGNFRYVLKEERGKGEVN
jgi:hypothetical protein